MSKKEGGGWDETVPELKQWQTAWRKTRAMRKPSRKICLLRLTMGTPLFHAKRCFISFLFLCTMEYGPSGVCLLLVERAEMAVNARVVNKSVRRISRKPWQSQNSMSLHKKKICGKCSKLCALYLILLFWFLIYQTLGSIISIMKAICSKIWLIK